MYAEPRSFLAWGPAIGDPRTLAVVLFWVVTSGVVALALADGGHAVAAVARWIFDGGAPGLLLLHGLLFLMLATVSVAAAALTAAGALRVTLGGDGLRIRRRFSRDEVIYFGDVASVEVGRAVELVLRSGGSLALYLRPCIALRALDAIGRSLLDGYAHRRPVRGASRRLLPYDDFHAFAAELQSSWERYRDSAARSEQMAARLRLAVEGVATSDYRSSPATDEELKDAMSQPALEPRLRVAAARTLAARHAAEPTALEDAPALDTVDAELEEKLRQAMQRPDGKR